MKRLTITIGISGSGKSTWSHEQWGKDPNNTVIVNRDNIRALLFGYTDETIKDYYRRSDVMSLEKLVTRYEDTLINDGLNHGKHVIVDATHLKRQYLERFKYWNVPTELRIFNVSITEAVKRDMKRARQVGDKVIKRQYDDLKKLSKQLVLKPIDFTPVIFVNDKKKPPVFIFDIDGTLAHMGDKRSPYDWGKVRQDSVDSSVKSVLDNIHLSRIPPKIVICTGRDGKALFETKRWLNDYSIYCDEIYIRKEGDMRPDWVVKEEMWKKIAEGNYIEGIFDDRLQVVRRARALGLKVFNVEYNNF